MNETIFNLTVGCLKDTDCGLNSTLLCYRNVSWIEETSRVGICTCNSFYDWTGDDCTTLTPGTYFIVLCNILLMLGNIYIVIASGIVCKTLGIKNTIGSAIGTSTIFASLLAIANICWRIFELINTVNPHDFRFPRPETGEKRAKYADGVMISAASASVFATISLMNVSFCWIEVSQRAKILSKSSKRNVHRYRTLWAGLAIGLAIFQAGSFAFNKYGLVSIVILPFNVVIMLTYIWGGRKMNTMFQVLHLQLTATTTNNTVGNSSVSESQIEAKKSRTRATAKLVQSTVKSVVRSLLLVWLTGLVYGICNLTRGGYRSWSVAGQVFKINVVANEMLGFAVTWAGWSVVRYTFTSTIKKHGTRANRGIVPTGNASTKRVFNLQNSSAVASDCVRSNVSGQGL